MSNYKWLSDEKSPKLIVEAVKLIGTKETPGGADNPVILDWAVKTKLNKEYKKDEIPWCGLFVAYVCHMASLIPIEKPLWAKNWAKWGVEQTTAMLGDILVFTREGGAGHVGFYVGEDSLCYHVLGGNQSDMVCVTRINKKRCIAIRRTEWKIAQPENVRVIELASTGVISKNES